VTGPLADRTALVTGASRNLGEVLAQHLADAGARVVVAARRDDAALRRVRDDLERRAPRGHALVALDGADLDAVPLALRELRGQVGPIDTLVNNAGPFSATPFSDLPTVEWRDTVDANLGLPVALVRELAGDLRTSGRGRIVNVAAGSAFVRDHGTYGLVKQALVTWTEALACELAPEVTVNAVAPGQILESAPEAEAVEPGFVDRCLARTPLGRLVTRDEVAALVVALLGPVFAPVTGVTVPIDGGWRLPRT
jgi:NAD(P)-dependent dehydrogenase (short-subunit alcohol dehydrogenase family)